VPYSLPLTRTETIVRHLREEIVTGRLAPGTVIKDAELAERLGVSITPVREAIVLLSAEGLIDISPNRTRRVTDVSQKNALELIDVMCVLACAGVEWGVPNLTDADLARMRQRLDEMLAGLRSGDVGAATSAGADFSTIMISASGNRELQTHVDLVVTRMRRLLGLTPESSHWRPWIDGYTEVLALLEQGDPQVAIARYRQIYAEVRAELESGESGVSGQATAQGLVTARPDLLR
jgi:DNA-binding GntR family transcriptional regulator